MEIPPWLRMAEKGNWRPLQNRAKWRPVGSSSPPSYRIHMHFLPLARFCATVVRNLKERNDYYVFCCKHRVELDGTYWNVTELNEKHVAVAR